jgi:hypothetical protein
MRRITPQLPVWMVEGLAEFYSNIRVEDKKVLVGAPSTSNLMILRQKTLLPLSTMRRQERWTRRNISQLSQKKMKELREAQASVAPAIEEAARAAAQSRSKAGTAGPLEVLTNTMGVDFGPYLNRVLHDVREGWYQLIPESASFKRGWVTIDFFILKDGSVQGLKVIDSTGDVTLERPAYGSIIASNPFRPLPDEFKGPYLGLRLHFYYNLNSTEIDQGSRRDSAQSARRSAGDDGALAVSPSGPMNVTLAPDISSRRVEFLPKPSPGL